MILSANLRNGTTWFLWAEQCISGCIFQKKPIKKALCGDYLQSAFLK